MLENPECLRRMVAQSGAVSTDYQSPESAAQLCGKTTPYAARWKETADRLWHSCGPRRFHQEITLMRAEVADGAIRMEKVLIPHEVS